MALFFWLLAFFDPVTVLFAVEALYFLGIGLLLPKCVYLYLVNSLGIFYLHLSAKLLLGIWFI